MRKMLFFAGLIILIIIGTQTSALTDNDTAVETRDGVLVHIKAGPEDPHKVLMALNMAVLMSETKPVLVYMDIEAVKVFLKDSPDIKYSHFPSSHAALKTLLSRNVPVMVCPGCLKAAEKGKSDLIDGPQIADKDTFFNFTSGRIITLDY